MGRGADDSDTGERAGGEGGKAEPATHVVDVEDQEAPFADQGVAGEDAGPPRYMGAGRYGAGQCHHLVGVLVVVGVHGRAEDGHTREGCEECGMCDDVDCL